MKLYKCDQSQVASLNCVTPQMGIVPYVGVACRRRECQYSLISRQRYAAGGPSGGLPTGSVQPHTHYGGLVWRYLETEGHKHHLAATN